MTTPRMHLFYNSTSRAPRPTIRAHSAFILVAVLVLILLGSMVVLSLMFRMQAQRTASQGAQASEQAYQTAMSGVQLALSIASQSKPGNTDWRNLPRVFQHQMVSDDGSDQWFFTVYSPPEDDATTDLRYGLTDEASKLNLNSAHTTNLMEVVQLTSPLVATLRDFVDEDDLTRPEGAEQEIYNQKATPYKTRNGPLATVGELLLVHGFTPGIVYGEDANMNWRLDPNEDDGMTQMPPDNHDGRLQLGLASLMTTFSSEPNQTADGLPRININRKNDALPHSDTPSPWTNFVQSARTAGIQFHHPSELLDAKIRIKDQRGTENEIASGVDKDNLATVLDLLTCSPLKSTEGLINVNTAPAQVLTAIPGIDEPLADAILSARKSISPEKRVSLAWLLQEGVTDSPHFKAIAPFLTTRSYQFSFRVVGYSVPSGQYRTLDAVIDVSQPRRPQIVFLRDLTKLGPPFPLRAPDSSSVSITRPNQTARASHSLESRVSF